MEGSSSLDLNIHVFIHSADESAILARLRDISHSLDKLNRKEDAIMADLTQLTADVAADTTVSQSAVTLIEGIAAALAAAATDPAAISALSSQLQQNATALAAAVAANTPAAASASARR